MNTEGRIRVRLLHVGDAVQAARIESLRPLSAPSMFEARDPASVPKAVPLVFSVCAAAQGVTAVRAIQAALDVLADPELDAARDRLVLAEVVREHLWRVMIDWPSLRGESASPGLSLLGTVLPGFRRALFADTDPFALDASPRTDRVALRAAARELSRLIDEHVLGVYPDAWLELDPAGFHRWLDGPSPAARHLAWLDERGISGLGAVATTFLPPLTGEALATRLRADSDGEFVARPTWEGERRETGPFARRFDHPLVNAMIGDRGAGLAARQVARLVELAAIQRHLLDLNQPFGLRAGHTTSLADAGASMVETARGLLAHYVEISDGRVARYRILAPTEWNFHPSGIAARGLLTLRGSRRAVCAQARHWLGAIDPCVGLDLEIE